MPKSPPPSSVDVHLDTVDYTLELLLYHKDHGVYIETAEFIVHK